MKKIKTKKIENMELPLQFSVSFEKVFTYHKKYASQTYKNHPNHKSSVEIIKEFKKSPELIDGFSDLSLFEKYKDQIDRILDPLFPEALLLNEIKAASIPFSFTTFKLSTRFENILNDAPDDYELKVRNFNDEIFYILACTMILGMHYQYPIDLKRPFFFDIPDKDGNIKNYRVAFNADLSEIIKTKNAPEVTEEDIKILLDSFNNVEIWKEKFPPNSYIFKGFGIMNLFEVTADEAISEIKDDLLQSSEGLIQKLQKDFSRFYNIKDIMVGFSIYDKFSGTIDESRIPNAQSLMVLDSIESDCFDFFCNEVVGKVIDNTEPLAISDVEKYGELTNRNKFYRSLKSKGIGSILIIPFKVKDREDLVILEIASPRPYELNSINQHKLEDIIPVFQTAVERATKERQNKLEATIQEFYTSIHPTVKWRFYEAADKYVKAINNPDGELNNIELDEIIFNDVYPLFGQSDIKGSSLARNEAVAEDLTTQLTLAINVLTEANKTEKLIIYDELTFLVQEYLESVKKGLKVGDEIGILDFLKREIYPVFNHIKKINKTLYDLIDVYTNRLDPDLQVVYEKRKDYEQGVKLLNDTLANYIDDKQREAQEMFPHYFERYKTDGVEFNMYIGQSLVRGKEFEDLYLYNLRLWQLRVMYEMENLAYNTSNKEVNNLQIASLILVHSNSLQIKFRMDEKQFDVEGAYNIRYEIIKKRIDKAHVKGTKERITTPGKLAIIYSQESEAFEYMKYLKFLQSKNIFGKIEQLEIEDLQGISGLKALRVEIIYQEDYEEKSAEALEELIKEIQS